MLKDLRLEISEILSEVMNYLTNSWTAINPMLTWFVTLFVWMVFPIETFIAYSKIVVIVIILDLFSKYYSITKRSGGFLKALKTGRLSSKRLWIGTRRKIVSYLLIMILVGLAYRITPIEIIGTVAYATIFLRETQSVAENMVDAGHKELQWFIVFISSKREQILKDNNIDVKDYDMNGDEKSGESKTLDK